MAKRIVIWGTGFVGKMVIPEVLRHPDFELVGVGVSNPAKVGVDVGEICGLPGPTGVLATDDVDALLPDTDVLVLVLPKSPATDHVLDARRLALLPYWRHVPPSPATCLRYRWKGLLMQIGKMG